MLHLSKYEIYKLCSPGCNGNWGSSNERRINKIIATSPAKSADGTFNGYR